MEILAAKDQFGAASPPEKAELKRLKARLSSRLLPYRDSNGFRRLIVVSTASGKVYGLHSGDGRVLWSLSFPPASQPAQLVVWRKSHDPTHAPQVALFGKSSAGGTVQFFVVDVYAGAVLSSENIPFHAAQVLEVPRKLLEGPEEQSVFILVGPVEGTGEPKIRVVPNTAPAKALVASLTNYFPFTWDREHNQLVGYRVTPKGSALQPLWTAVFPASSDSILTVAAPLHQHVYSYAKVLGDRSMKLKYLNPNTVFVATGPPEGVPSGDLQRAPHVTVAIVDTINWSFPDSLGT
eukprot:jgi/Botrbrau1/21187/Bobra.0061s0078.1